MQPGGSERTFVEEARRGQIVDTTLAVIADDGLERASFARIARAARISPALISYYFGSRERLLDEVLRVADARMDEAMAGGPDEPASYADALRRILTGYVQRCATHPAEVTAAQAIRDAAHDNTAAAPDAGTSEMVEFLREAQENGEFRPFDPVVFADAVFAAMHGVPRRVRGRTPEQCAELADQLGTLFVRAALAHDGDREPS